MFLADTQRVRFQPTEHNGFDAIDLTVMDIALQEVEAQACSYLPLVDLVTIEFARNDYREALQQFTPSFLRDAYFLFLDADMETCLLRVYERVARSNSIDDHPSFSEAIFRQYYQKENATYMTACLQREFALCNRVKVISNTGPLDDFTYYIEQFVEGIFRQETCNTFIVKRNVPTASLLE